MHNKARYSDERPGQTHLNRKKDGGFKNYGVTVSMS